MAIEKVANLAGIGPAIAPGGVQDGVSSGPGGHAGGAEFQRMLEQLQPVAGTGQVLPGGPVDVTGLKFSNHAVERMQSRGISFAPDEMRGIESAISKAAAKGAKDTLVLSGDNALIVSVKNKTVVTVMDRAAMKENVFTNIDSTVVI